MYAVERCLDQLDEINSELPISFSKETWDNLVGARKELLANKSEIESLQEKVKQLEAERQWVSVEDRLPKHHELVIIRESGRVRIQVASRENPGFADGWAFWVALSTSRWSASAAKRVQFQSSSTAPDRGAIREGDESCCEMWRWRPEGRGVVLGSTSNSPTGANAADWRRFPVTAGDR